MSERWPLGRPRTVQCARCVPTYCGQGCKQAAHFERKFAASEVKAVEAKTTEVLPQSTEATEAIRALIRSELWDLLTKAGVVAGPMPPADTETAP
jgi:hypothetical protein